jgi:hypothetical protein
MNAAVAGNDYEYAVLAMDLRGAAVRIKPRFEMRRSSTAAQEQRSEQRQSLAAEHVEVPILRRGSESRAKLLG